MHIAIFTNDEPLATPLRAALHDIGFGSTLIGNPSEIQTVAAGQDLMILDLAATGNQLSEILANVRSAAPNLPYLAVTAGDENAERVDALKIGMDDAVSRSFSATEVALRCHSIVRRSAGKEQMVYKYADVVLDRISHSATRAGKPLPLTGREYRTLEYFIRNPGRVVSPQELCEQVWKFHFDPGSNVVQVFVMRLRKKIDDGFSQKLIQTVPKGGYVMRLE
jgi:DNA-binding response OmpR family regulator